MTKNKAEPKTIDRMIGFKALQALEDKENNQIKELQPILMKHGYFKVMDNVYKNSSSFFATLSKFIHSNTMTLISSLTNGLIRSSFVNGFVLSFFLLEIGCYLTFNEINFILLTIIMPFSIIIGILFDLIKTNKSI